MDQSSSGAAGRTQQALKFRMVTHVTSAQSVEVGDVEGHVASLARFSGLAFFPDEVAIVSFVSTTDYINGEGEFVLYPVIIFDDGATLCIRSCGRGKVEGAKTKFVGTLTVVNGKGRFACSIA